MSWLVEVCSRTVARIKGCEVLICDVNFYINIKMYKVVLNFII